jgi:hypothetical protein
MRGTVVALALFLLGGCLAETARAQEPAKPASTLQHRPERYLRLDLFAGGAAHQVKDPPKNENGEVEAGWGEYGWETGATLSVGIPWLGVTGSIGKYNIENVPAYHLLVGPRFTSEWGCGGLCGRAFVHALAGFSRTSGGVPPQTSGEFALGFGVDIMPLFLRIQGDQVWLNLNGLPRGYFRIFAGGVVPLCLSACRDTDMINVSSRQP